MSRGAAAQEAHPGSLVATRFPLYFQSRKFGNNPKYQQVRSIPAQDSPLFSPSLRATETGASQGQTLAASQGGGTPAEPSLFPKSPGAGDTACSPSRFPLAGTAASVAFSSDLILRLSANVSWRRCSSCARSRRA